MLLALMKLPIPKFSVCDWNGFSLCNAERTPSIRISSADEQKMRPALSAISWLLPPTTLSTLYGINYSCPRSPSGVEFIWPDTLRCSHTLFGPCLLPDIKLVINKRPERVLKSCQIKLIEGVKNSFILLVVSSW